MKLVHSSLSSQFNFDDKINVLCVENGRQFRHYLEEIHCQIDGYNGNFVLSNGEKNFDFSKEVAVVTDFFALNFEEKKIQNKLYSNLQCVLEECFQSDFDEFNSKFYSILNKLNAESPYELDFGEVPSFSNVLKCFGVTFAYENGDFLEKICKFSEIIIRLLNIKLIVFVNLKSYFIKKELKLLYEFFIYNGINVLLLENSYNVKLEQEFCVIVDDDLCEIIA